MLMEVVLRDCFDVPLLFFVVVVVDVVCVCVSVCVCVCVGALARRCALASFFPLVFGWFPSDSFFFFLFLFCAATRPSVSARLSDGLATYLVLPSLTRCWAAHSPKTPNKTRYIQVIIRKTQ